MSYCGELGIQQQLLPIGCASVKLGVGTAMANQGHALRLRSRAPIPKIIQTCFVYNRRALARLRDHSLRLRDHPGPVGGWQSVCWGGTPYFRLFNVIWYLPSPYYRLFNVLWYLPSPYYRLFNVLWYLPSPYYRLIYVLWVPFLKIKKFRVPSLEKSLGYIPAKHKV